MKIFLPDNIFTRTLLTSINNEDKKKVVFESCSLVAKKLNENHDSIALIPTLELIKNQHFYISRSFGISFDGLLCNSYIYFYSEQEQFGRINIAGDISSMEVIITKLLFKELYNTDVELKISADVDEEINDTHVIVGDSNFKDARFEGGLSFAEEIVQLISAPYVNFVFASTDEALLKNWLAENLAGLKKIDFSTVDFNPDIDEKSRKFITENASHIYLNLERQDIVGINELIRMTYYHGIIKDLFEVNFV